MIEGNKSKGNSFEKLAYTYFQTDPKFQNIKNVWRQKDIPMTPDRIYANSGWKGWKDFLGTP